MSVLHLTLSSVEPLVTSTQTSNGRGDTVPITEVREESREEQNVGCKVCIPY